MVKTKLSRCLSTILAALSRDLRPIVGALGVGLGFGGLANGQNPLQPAINPLQPLAQSRVTPFDLNLAGSQLHQPTGVWLSFPGVASIQDPGAKPDPTKATIKVQPGPNAPAGLQLVRLATRYGVGPDRTLWLDDFAPDQVIQALPAAKERATAQPIATPSLVQGKVDAERADWFRLKVAAPQTLVFEVIGRRLGSALDPQVTLFDLAGRELPKGHSNDAPGLQGDPRLIFQFAQPAEILVQVRDAAWQGGGDFQYLLRIADCPAATCAYPLAVKRGSKALVGFAGPRIDGAAPVEVVAPLDPFQEATLVSPRRITGLAGTPVTVHLSDLDELTEVEPNDTVEKAQAIPGNCGVSGRFEKKGDLDRFRFKATKDQRLIIEGHTVAMGSPAEVLLTIQDAKGNKLAETSPAQAARLDWKAPADGEYLIQVEHLHLWGGVDEVYRVSVSPYQAGFSLSLQADRFEGRQDGTAEIPVIVTRQDYPGPIEISAYGPAGVTGSLVIPAGQPAKPAEPAGVLKLSCPSALPKGVYPLMVLGSADVNGRKVAKPASVLGPIRAGMANLPFPPKNWENRASLAIIDPAPFRVSARLDPATPVAPGKETALVVSVERAPGFVGDVAISVAGLPANVTAALTPIAKDKSEVRIPIKAAANAAEGKANLVVTGKGKVLDKELSFNAGAVELTLKK